MKSMAEIKPAVRRLFRSRDGEIVLEHLLDRFYHNRIKDETLVRQVGQRDVLVHIKHLLTEDKHEPTVK